MRKGLVRVGKKFQLQLGVPKAVRHDFGVQKKTWMINTSDEREAELIADRHEREFRAQVLQSKQNALQGDYLDPKRALMVTGWLFWSHACWLGCSSSTTRCQTAARSVWFSTGTTRSPRSPGPGDAGRRTPEVGPSGERRFHRFVHTL